MNTLKNYARGIGDNRIIQGIADYGSAAALGTGAQQLTNMVTGGADPNPFISGALAAPALTMAGRYGRAFVSGGGSDMFMSAIPAITRQISNPISQGALTGSAASLIGGGATNLYNTFAGGTDIDPNYAAASLALLGGIAPLTYRMLNK